jgi:hypothetical protein
MATFSLITLKQRLLKSLGMSRLTPQSCFKRISGRISPSPSILPWPIIISLLSHHWPSIVLGFIAALGVFYFLSQWGSVLAARRAKRIARLINSRLDAGDFFYGSGGFAGRLIRATVNSDRSLNLEILRLDYSQSAQFLTSEAVCRAPIDPSAIKGVLGRRQAILMPETIALGTNILRLLPDGSEYQFLVCQHHHAWMLSQRLKEYAGQLVNEIDSIDKKSKKYLDQNHIPDAKTRLEQVRKNKTEQHQQVISALSDIGRIIEGLTVRIESIEDFGGLLLGIDDNLAGFKSDSTHEQPIDIESVQQDCEEIALLLESYEDLLS